MGDLSSTRITGTGTVAGGRRRLLAISAVGAAGAGRLTLKDGGASGTTLVDVDIPTGVTSTLNFYIGGDGVLFRTDIYASALTATGVTLFYSS